MQYINKSILKFKYLEQLVWSAALLFLFYMDPASSGNSFCIAGIFGFDHCPGCGIGHSIHYALHFELLNSWKEHFMGIPATLVLVFQIFKPLIKNKTLYHGSSTTLDVKRPSAR